MQKLMIDRFEGEYAVCEDAQRGMHQILRSLLPHGAKEGDCIVIAQDGRIAIDESETEKRRMSAVELTARLFEK